MPQLDREARVADVIHVAIADAVERLHEHEDGARRGGDPEDVHQARVAARRLRSDLKTFHAFCDPEWTSDVRAELAWLGGELGAVRDIEVMLQRLRADERALPDSEQDAAERVVRRLLADWEGGAYRDAVGARVAALSTRCATGSTRPSPRPTSPNAPRNSQSMWCRESCRNRGGS